MEVKINQVDFEIAVNSFHDEVMNRLEFLNNIEIQFLRRYQCQINVPQTHASLVNYLRNMISTLEQTYKDVQSYFADLGITFAYEFFRKIQLLMVNGYNFLAQALVIHIDQLEQDRKYRAKTKEVESVIIPKKMINPTEGRRGETAQLEHFDYQINFYQNEESKLSQELHKMQENLMLSKGLVDKLQPSKAVKELTEIKERAEVTLQNTQRIFEETYQLKYLEFKQYLSKLQKPEDLTQQFCKNIKIAMKDKFTNGMKKSMHIMYHIMKENQINKCTQSSCQTQEFQIHQKLTQKKVIPSKNNQKLHTLLIRERKLTEKLLVDTQILKKQNQNLSSDKERLNGRVKELESKIEESQANYKILTHLYEEKREEVDRLNKEIIKKDGNIQRLKIYQFKYLERYTACEFAVQVNCTLSIVDKQSQTHLQDNEIINILKKTNERMGERIREKQYKIKQIQKRQIYEKNEKLRRMKINPTIVSQHFILGEKKIVEEDTEKQEEQIAEGQVCQPNRQSLDEKRMSEISQESAGSSSQHQLQSLSLPQLQPQQKQIFDQHQKQLQQHHNQQQVLTTKSSKSKLTRFSIMRNKKTHKMINYSTGLQQEHPSAQLKPEEQMAIEIQQEYGIDCEVQTDPVCINPMKIEVTNLSEPLKNMKKIKITTTRTNPTDNLTQRLYNGKSRKAHYLDNIVQSDSPTDNKNTDQVPNYQYSSSNLKSTKSKIIDSNESESARQGAEYVRDRLQLFQRLDIQTEQSRANLQKKMALSKKFLCQVANSKKKDAIDTKNKTCAEEFYKAKFHKQESNEDGSMMSIIRANSQVFNVQRQKKKTILFDISSKKMNKGFSLKENKEIQDF